MALMYCVVTYARVHETLHRAVTSIRGVSQCTILVEGMGKSTLKRGANRRGQAHDSGAGHHELRAATGLTAVKGSIKG